MKPLDQLNGNQRGAADTASAPAALSSKPTAYAHYHKSVDWDLYHDVARQIGVPHSMPSGMIAHFAGQSGDQIDVYDLWSDSATMDDFFAVTLAESITNSIAAVTRRNDIEPEHAEIAQLTFGVDAYAYVNSNHDDAVTDFFDRDDRPVGYMIGGDDQDAAGFVRACGNLGFPGLVPAGMIAQLVDRTKARTVVFDAWVDAGAAKDWYVLIEAELGSSKGVERREIDLKRISLKPELFKR